MSDNAQWHQETRARVVALEEKCASLQKQLDELINSIASQRTIQHNLEIDRRTQCNNFMWPFP